MGSMFNNFDGGADFRDADAESETNFSNRVRMPIPTISLKEKFDMG